MQFLRSFLRSFYQDHRTLVWFTLMTMFGWTFARASSPDITALTCGSITVVVLMDAEFKRLREVTKVRDP